LWNTETIKIYKMQIKDVLEKVKFTGPVLIVIAALLWAFDGVLRRSLYDLPPITIIFFEHMVGMLILLPFLISFRKIDSLSKKEWWIMGLVSLLSGLLGTLFFTTALLKVSFISFSVVFLLQKLQPIFAITTAHIFLKEQFNKKYIIWAGLALVSAYFVTFPNGIINLETGKGTIVAALFALGAAAAWGSSTTFSKMLLASHDSIYITSIRFTLTTIMAGVAMFILGAYKTLTIPTTPQIATLVVIALSTGMVALLIYYKGLKQTPVRITTILELAFPLVAILIDVFLYDSFLTVSQYVAGAVLIFTIYRISKLQIKNEI
jgi:drug/metabolite transporter (DMT)-like permease